MTSSLPSEVVVVIEGIVGKDLRICASADRAGATKCSSARTPNILRSEAYILLCAKRYANDRVAIQAKFTGRVARDSVIPTNARKTKAGFVDYIRRKSVNETCASYLRGISIVRGEKHRDKCCGKVAARSLRIKTVDPVRGSRRPINFEVLLIIR